MRRGDARAAGSCWVRRLKTFIWSSLWVSSLMRRFQLWHWTSSWTTDTDSRSLRILLRLRFLSLVAPFPTGRVLGLRARVRSTFLIQFSTHKLSDVGDGRPKRSSSLLFLFKVVGSSWRGSLKNDLCHHKIIQDEHKNFSSNLLLSAVP